MIDKINQSKRNDRRSQSAHEYRHLYKTARWQKDRLAQLDEFPLCALCLEYGEVVAATIVDHVEPHRGNEELFFNGKKQSLCKPCHDGPKQREEAAGKLIGCDVNGFPRDPDSPWSQA